VQAILPGQATPATRCSTVFALCSQRSPIGIRLPEDLFGEHNLIGPCKELSQSILPGAVQPWLFRAAPVGANSLSKYNWCSCLPGHLLPIYLFPSKSLRSRTAISEEVALSPDHTEEFQMPVLTIQQPVNQSGGRASGVHCPATNFEIS